jgi:hypothetical protein
MNRILLHEIELFGLNKKAIWQVIQTFVQHCETFSSKTGDILVADQGELRTLRLDIDYVFLNLFESNEEKIETAIAQLLRQPRMLKAALRRTWMAWQQLHGEVSLSDLLVYHVIHAVDANAIAFLRDHWSQLASRSDKNQQERQAKVRSQWEAHVLTTGDRHRERLWLLIQQLFPSALQ